MKKIALIGGGAQNLLLAALLSKNKNILVDIIEIRERVGKKILETGNGKCNFTNIDISKEDYNNELFVNNIIKYNIVDTFASLGLLSYSDEENRCYPYSNAANSILDLLRSTYLKNSNIKEIVNANIKEIKKENNYYSLIINNQKYTYDYLVLGIGSKVNNNLYKLLPLDLKINQYSPSLCPLSIKINGLKGIRVKGKISLLDDSKLIYQEKGEIIFKDNGISGISIFNISFYLNKYNINKPKISIDLFNELTNEELYNILKNKINLEPNDFFIGITNKMLSLYLIKRLNLVSKIKEKDLDIIISTLKNLTFDVLGFIDAPQVAKGGVNLKEINSNLELIKYPNIYIGGEMIDIDGRCGGFNLHFAFSCALHIYNELKEKINV